MTLNNLGNVLITMGEVAKAEPLIREALALDRQMFGERHDYTAESLRNLGTVLRLQGDVDGAERAYRQALDVNRSLFGAEHTRVATNLQALGITLQMKRTLKDAIPLLREARAQYGRLQGEKERSFVVCTVSLARALLEDGNAAEAEVLMRGVAGGAGGEELQLEVEVVRCARLKARTAVSIAHGRSSHLTFTARYRVTRTCTAFGVAGVRCATPQEKPSASGSATGVAACGGPWPRSGGCARG
jgi:hypothetical protein